MLHDLVHEVLSDARHTLRRHADDGEPRFYRQRDLDRHLAETAADLAFERLPQLQERIARERLIEIITSEIGN